MGFEVDIRIGLSRPEKPQNRSVGDRRTLATSLWGVKAKTADFRAIHSISQVP